MSSTASEVVVPLRQAMAEDPLLNEERRRAILAMLQRDGRVLVHSIVRHFGVSPVTARNDLSALEKRGYLRRVHGGAVAAARVGDDAHLQQKSGRNAEEKLAIALAALRLIHPGETIVLDSGSTCTELGRLLPRVGDLTVITSALNIATELAGTNVNVMVTGGMVRENSFSLVGPLAEASLAQLSADKCFLGVDGLDASYGLTTPNLLEAKLNRCMLETAREVILLADSSKFGRRSLSQIAPIGCIHRLITDEGAPREEIRKLIEMGVQVTLAEAS